MKKLPLILIVVLVIIAVLVVGKNFIIKFAVEQGVRAATGLSLTIKQLNIGIFSTQMGIKDLSLYNPSGFPEEPMFFAPEIFVDYRLGGMIGGKVHLDDVRLDFDRFVIVKNAQGKTNLEALKPKESQTKTKVEPSDKKTVEKKKAPQIQIDHISYKVGKLIYKDYSKGGEPIIKEYNINLSGEMKDVTNAQQLLGFVAARALAKTSLSNVIGFSEEMLYDPTMAPKKVIDTLKGTADTLKDTIKLPFGNK